MPEQKLQLYLAITTPNYAVATGVGAAIKSVRRHESHVKGSAIKIYAIENKLKYRLNPDLSCFDIENKIYLEPIKDIAAN